MDSLVARVQVPVGGWHRPIRAGLGIQLESES